MTVSMESEGEAETDEIGYVATDGYIRGEVIGVFDNRTDFETETYVSPTTTYRRSAEDGSEMSDWSSTETGLEDGGLTIGSDGIEAVAAEADAELEGTEAVDGDEAYVLSLLMSTPNSLAATR